MSTTGKTNSAKEEFQSNIKALHRYYENREDSLRDYYSFLAAAREEGYREGLKIGQIKKLLECSDPKKLDLSRVCQVKCVSYF